MGYDRTSCDMEGKYVAKNRPTTRSRIHRGLFSLVRHRLSFSLLIPFLLIAISGCQTAAVANDADSKPTGPSTLADVIDVSFASRYANKQLVYAVKLSNSAETTSFSGLRAVSNIIGLDCTIAELAPKASASCIGAQQLTKAQLVAGSIDVDIRVSNSDSAVVHSYPKTLLSSEYRDAENTTTFRWPDQADGDVPFGGVFYGNPFAGKRTSNAALFWYEASRRFRAERSGKIVALRHHNRTLLMANIVGRCKSRPNSVWCDCVAAQLDEYSCGYHLSNSYSVGNGGLIQIEIRADDGTASHHPSDVVLGRAKEPFVPLDHSDKLALVFELEKPVDLNAGDIYHIVYRQLNPASKCTRMKLPVDQARQCERDAGVIGLNGYAFTHDVWRGPVLGKTSAILQRNTGDERFKLNTSHLSFYEVQYQDGTWVGETYGYYLGDISGKLGGMRTFGGQDQVRQRFTVQDVTREVNGLWVSLGRHATRSQEGVTVELRSNADQVLAVERIPFSSIPLCENFCAAWVYVAFDETITLTKSKEYTVVLSTNPDALFVINTGFPIDYKPFEFESRNVWSESKAEFSANGGDSWEPFTVNAQDEPYYAERDLSLVFTLKGMPRQLP